MDQDPEKRIGDLEQQLAEQKRDADREPAHHDAEMAFPSQTPGYRRRKDKKSTRRILMLIAPLYAVPIGFFLIDWGREDGVPAGVGWLGVAMIFLSVLIVLIAVPLAIRAIAGLTKDRGRREPGAVELLTVASSFDEGLGNDRVAKWELRSEMQIRLDTGHTFRGSYYATIENWRLRKPRRAYTPDGVEIIRSRPSGGALLHFDEWFLVGASLRCVYNPTNPDQLVVLPFAVRGERVRYSEITVAGSDFVWFRSAT
jgi:hypothetical protein